MLPSRKKLRLLSPDRPIYARRMMKFGGESYTAGQEIKWRDLELPLALVQSWFRNRFVSHYPLGDQSEPAVAERRETPVGPHQGPTIETFVAHGYDPSKYPPSGFLPKSSPGLKIFQETGTLPAELVQVARVKMQADDKAMQKRRDKERRKKA